MLLQRLKGFVTDIVFNFAGVVLGGFCVDSNGRKEGGQNKMAFLDFIS